MTPFAAILVLASTLFHAGWNLLARKERSEHTFLLRAIAAVGLLGLAPALVAFILLPTWPPRAWLCAGLTGIFSGVYFFALARAYSHGDFTVVYPVARAVPVLLVPLGDIARGRPPTALGWLGIIMVAVACFVMPLHSLKEIHLRHYLNRTMFWVLLAALGTTAYSINDKIAIEAVATVSPGPLAALLYGYVFYALSAFVMLTLCALLGRKGETRATVGWRNPILAGFLTFCSYGLVLWAYQFVDHAGYVVAFRQFSILIGVVVAIICFREKGARLRFFASCIMVLGLILIGIFGHSTG